MGSQKEDAELNKGYSARECSEVDLPAIADFFNRHNYGPKVEGWLRWKFLDNPAGHALMHVVEDPDNNIVGFQARMPRKMKSEHTGTFTPRQEVDTFISPQERGKKLRDVIWKVAGPKRDYLSMGFPNRIYRQMLNDGPEDTIIALEIWWYPVNVGGLISKKWYGFIAPLANVLSWYYSVLHLGSKPKDLELRPVEKFNRDYELDMAYIQGDRSAEYLNWRFIDNPMRKYSACEFFEGEESIGYCAYAEEQNAAELFDFVTGRRPKNCLRLLVDHCRARQITHLSFRCGGFDFEDLGFIRRDAGHDYIISDKKDGGPYRPHGEYLITLTDSDY